MNTVNWVCEEIVRSFPIKNTFKCNLEDLSEKDYPGNHYFKHDIPAINLDGYESSLTGNNKCTADAAVGICNERQGKAVSKRLLIVELRMGYNNENNLHASDIQKKINRSLFLLRDLEPNVAIDPVYCLIFNPSFINRSISWLEREKRQYLELKSCEAFNPNSFCTFINAGRSIPYTPLAETKRIADKIRDETKNCSFDYLEKNFNYIRDYYGKCKTRYELVECKIISDAIQESLCVLENCYNPSTLEDSLIFEIIKEDCKRAFGLADASSITVG